MIRNGLFLQNKLSYYPHETGFQAKQQGIIDKKSGLIISKEFTKERCIYMYKEGFKEIDNIRQEKWYSDIVKDYQENSKYNIFKGGEK